MTDNRSIPGTPWPMPSTTYFVTDDSELTEIIKREYPTIEIGYSDLVCWEEPGGGDSGGYMYYCIDGELSDYADVEKMISNTAKYPSLKPLMQDLCSNGIIPKGNYKVYFCWG